LVTLPKNFLTRVLGSVVVHLYTGECTPSVDRALMLNSGQESNEKQFLRFLVRLNKGIYLGFSTVRRTLLITISTTRKILYIKLRNVRICSFAGWLSTHKLILN